jgi:hypothetical protein
VKLHDAFGAPRPRKALSAEVFSAMARIDLGKASSRDHERPNDAFTLGCFSAKAKPPSEV